MQVFLMDLRIYLRENWHFAGAAFFLILAGVGSMLGAPAWLRYGAGGLGLVFLLAMLVRGSLRPVKDEDGRQLSVKEVRGGGTRGGDSD